MKTTGIGFFDDFYFYADVMNCLHFNRRCCSFSPEVLSNPVYYTFDECDDKYIDALKTRGQCQVCCCCCYIPCYFC